MTADDRVERARVDRRSGRVAEQPRHGEPGIDAAASGLSEHPRGEVDPRHVVPELGCQEGEHTRSGPDVEDPEAGDR